MCQKKEINLLSSAGEKIAADNVTCVFSREDTAAINEKCFLSGENRDRLSLPDIDNGKDSFSPIETHLGKKDKRCKRDSGNRRRDKHFFPWSERKESKQQENKISACYPIDCCVAAGIK